VDEDLPVMMKLMRRGEGGFNLNRKLESQIRSKGLQTATKYEPINWVVLLSNDTLHSLQIAAHEVVISHYSFDSASYNRHDSESTGC